MRPSDANSDHDACPVIGGGAVFVGSPIGRVSRRDRFCFLLFGKYDQCPGGVDLPGLFTSF